MVLFLLLQMDRQCPAVCVLKTDDLKPCGSESVCADVRSEARYVSALPVSKTRWTHRARDCWTQSIHLCRLRGGGGGGGGQVRPPPRALWVSLSRRAGRPSQPAASSSDEWWRTSSIPPLLPPDTTTVLTVGSTMTLKWLLQVVRRLPSHHSVRIDIIAIAVDRIDLPEIG